MDKNRIGAGKIGSRIKTEVADNNPFSIGKKFIPKLNGDFSIGLNEDATSNSFFETPSISKPVILGEFSQIKKPEEEFEINSNKFLQSLSTGNGLSKTLYDESSVELKLTSPLQIAESEWGVSYGKTTIGELKEAKDDATPFMKNINKRRTKWVMEELSKEPSYRLSEPGKEGEGKKDPLEEISKFQKETLKSFNVIASEITLSEEEFAESAEFLRNWKKYSFGYLDNELSDFINASNNFMRGIDLISKDLQEVEAFNMDLASVLLGIEKGKGSLMREALDFYRNYYFYAPYPFTEFDKTLKGIEGKSKHIIRDYIVGEFSRVMMDPDAEMQYFVAWISKSKEETPILISKGGYEAAEGKNANYFFYLDNIDFSPAQKTTTTINYGGIEIPVFTNHVEGKNVGKLTMWGDLGLSFYNYVLNHGLGYNTKKGTYSDVISNRKFDASNEAKTHGLKTNDKADDIDHSMLDLHVMMPGWYDPESKTFYVNHFILRAIKFQSINAIGFNHETKQIQHSIEFDYLKALWIHNRALKA